MLDWQEIVGARPWLYPIALVLEVLLGARRIDPTWILMGLAVVVLLANVDRVFSTKSSQARQPFRPRPVLQDLMLLFVQIGISKVVPLVLVVLAWREYAPALAVAIRGQLGLHWVLSAPSLRLTTLLLIGVAIAQDLVGYLTHRLQHGVSWLWELHKFHHSAESINIFTGYREHPLLMIMNRLGLALASTVLAVAALVVCPQLLESPVAAAGGLFTFLALKPLTFLHHHHRPISFGFLDGWIVTPATHAVHHSSDPAHHDKNFGVTLGIWDRLFSTHYEPSADELTRLRYGIEETRHVAGRVLPLHFLFVTLTRNAWRVLMERWPARAASRVELLRRGS